MEIITLIHPELGIVAQQVVMPLKKEKDIIRQWQYKYGQKFYECRTESNVTKKESNRTKTYTSSKKVYNIKTEETYPSVTEAAADMKMSQTTIYNHCNKKLLGFKPKYLVRWAS